MNNTTKSRLLTLAIILLLLANLATLTIFWLNKEGKLKPPPQQQTGGPFAFLVKELALDSAQTLAYSKIRNEHQQQVESYRGEIRKSKDALFDLLKGTNSNDSSLEIALNTIAEKEKAFDKVVFLHFQKVRALCNEKQQQKFDEIIQQALRMMPAANQQRQGPHPRREGEKQGQEPQGPPRDGDDRRPPPDGNGPPPQ